MAEFAPAVEIARQAEIHDAPEIGEGIFDGRAGERKMVQAVEAFKAAGVLGVAVFDVLAFIGNDAVKLDVFVERRIAAQRGVACQQERAWRDIGEQALAIFSGAGDNAVRQARRETLELGLPVIDEGGWHDDDGEGVGIFFVLVQEIGDGLQGFAEAHVVGENAAEAEPRQTHEPLIAGVLVAAQRGVEPFWQRRFGGFAAAGDLFGEGAKGCAAVEADAAVAFVEGVEGECAIERQLDGVVFGEGFRRDGAIGEQIADGADLGIDDVDVGIVGETDVFFAGAVGGEHFKEDVHAVDFFVEAQLKHAVADVGFHVRRHGLTRFKVSSISIWASGIISGRPSWRKS